MSFSSLIAMVAASVLPLGGAILEELETGNVAGFQHAGSISEIVTHPDGKHVLSSARDQCARLWELKSGKLIRRFTAPACGDMWGIRIIREGEEFLAATSSGKIYRFEMATGKVLMTYEHPGTAYRIALMPDGEHFVGTDGKNNVILWEIATGKKVRDFDGHNGDVYTAIVTEGGKALVTGSDDKTLKQWNVETGECRKTLKGKKPYGDVYTLALSPDRKRFAMVSEDGFLRVCDAASLKESWKVKLGKEGEVVTWSPDGKFLASTSEDKNLYLLNAVDGEVIRKIKVADRHHTPIAFSGDGKTLISGGDYHLHLHDVSSGERLVPERGIPKKNFSYDHIAISSGGERIYLADGPSWELRDRLDPTRNQVFSEEHEIASLMLSADGGLIAVGDSKGNMRILETAGFTVKVSFKTADAVQAIAFLPDGKSVITAGEDKIATLWEIASGKKIHEFHGHTKEIEAMIIAADGEYFYTAARDGSVRMWSLSERTQKAKYVIGKNRPDSIAIFDGGRSLMLAIDEKEVWGKLLRPLKPKEEIKVAEIKKLAEELAAEDFEKRQSAMVELASYGGGVLSILEELKIENPESQERIKSMSDVLIGLFPFQELGQIAKFEDDLSGIASDPLGVLWAGALGVEGASRLLIGDLDPESTSIRTLETVDLNHGVLQVVFSPEGGHLGTVNADGTYSLFKVNRP